MRVSWAQEPEPEPECFPGKRQEGKTILSTNPTLSCHRPFGALCQQHWQLVRVTVTSSAASPLSHQINLSLAPQRKVYITLGFSFVIVSSLMSSSMQGKAKRERDSLSAAIWSDSDWWVEDRLLTMKRRWVFFDHNCWQLLVWRRESRSRWERPTWAGSCPSKAHGAGGGRGNLPSLGQAGYPPPARQCGDPWQPCACLAWRPH